MQDAELRLQRPVTKAQEKPSTPKLVLCVEIPRRPFFFLVPGELPFLVWSHEGVRQQKQTPHNPSALRGGNFTTKSPDKLMFCTRRSTERREGGCCFKRSFLSRF